MEKNPTPTVHRAEPPPMEAVEALLDSRATSEQVLRALEWAVRAGTGSGVQMTPRDPESAIWTCVTMLLQSEFQDGEGALRVEWSAATPQSYRKALESLSASGSPPRPEDSPNIRIAIDSTQGAAALRVTSMEIVLNMYVAALWRAERVMAFSMPAGGFARETVRRLPRMAGAKAQIMLSQALSRSWEKAHLEASVLLPPQSAERASSSRSL